MMRTTPKSNDRPRHVPALIDWPIWSVVTFAAVSYALGLLTAVLLWPPR